MLLNEFFQPLNEARKPILVYHGTSDVTLASVLTNGVQPFPEKRVWEDDPQVHSGTLTRKSMGGSYWTSDWMTAYGSAGRAVQKLGGRDRVIIAARINEQSALADEDNVTAPLKQALGAILGSMQYEPSLDRLTVLTPYFWGEYAKPNKIREYVDLFRNTLSERLKEKHVLPFDQAKTVIETFILRALSHTEGYYRDRHLRDAGLDDTFRVPTKEEAEHACWEIRQKLTRTFKKTAYASNNAWHTMRTELPIGYRGKNHIVCVISLTRDDDISKPTQSIKIHYGTIPPEMKAAYEKSIGVYPPVVDVSRKG